MLMQMQQSGQGYVFVVGPTSEWAGESFVAALAENTTSAIDIAERQVDQRSSRRAPSPLSSINITGAATSRTTGLNSDSTIIS